MAGRATVRCSCGWGPQRCRSTTIARGCPECRAALVVPVVVPTIRVVLQLVEADLAELWPRAEWGRELRRMTREAAVASRAARRR